MTTAVPFSYDRGFSRIGLSLLPAPVKTAGLDAVVWLVAVELLVEVVGLLRELEDVPNVVGAVVAETVPEEAAEVATKAGTGVGAEVVTEVGTEAGAEVVTEAEVEIGAESIVGA